MKGINLEEFTLSELWMLHEQIGLMLRTKLEVEKLGLEKRLAELGRQVGTSPIEIRRRPYPKVFPKFQNPAHPSETWSGRGKKPRWVRELLAAGRTLDDVRISAA